MPVIHRYMLARYSSHRYIMPIITPKISSIRFLF